jgi:hypothetical protein
MANSIMEGEKQDAPSRTVFRPVARVARRLYDGLERWGFAGSLPKNTPHGMPC